MIRRLIFTFFLTSLMLMYVMAQSWDCSNSSVTRYRDQVFANVTENQGIDFANVVNQAGGKQKLQMDIYRPTGDSLSKRPLLVFAYGGAFLIGNKRQPPIPDYCRHFARLGYTVAAIDYRIGFNPLFGGSAERAVYRAVQDYRAALRWLVDNSLSYGIDTSAIFMTGTSAGCVAAIHSVYLDNNQRPPSTFGIPVEPGDLGHPDSSGNTNFDNREVRVHGIINHWGAIGDTGWIDGIPRDSVPMVSMHGTGDPIVPYNSGQPFSLPIWPTLYGSGVMHKRLDNLGVENTLYSWPGVGHEPELTSPKYLDSMFIYGADFMLEVLEPEGAGISGPDTVCAGSTQLYTAMVKAGSEVCWDVSGGTIDSVNSLQAWVRWTDLGTQAIRLTERSSLEVVGSPIEQEVHVAEPPLSGLIFVPDELRLEVDDTINVRQSVRVDFGDGSLAFGLPASNNYSSPGIYIVETRIGNGACAIVRKDTFELSECPIAEFDLSAQFRTVVLSFDSSLTADVSWIIEGDTLPGINGFEYTFPASGSFEIGMLLNQGNCSDYSSKRVTVLQPVSIGKPEGQAVLIYPNPASDRLYIEKGGAGSSQLIIRDLRARFISSHRFSNAMELSLDNLAPGSYLLELDGKRYRLLKH